MPFPQLNFHPNKIAQIPSTCPTGFYLPASNLLFTSGKLLSHLPTSPNPVFSLRLNSWKPIHFFPAGSNHFCERHSVLSLSLATGCTLSTFYYMIVWIILWSAQHPAEAGNNSPFLYVGINKIRFPWDCHNFYVIMATLVDLEVDA